MSRSATIQAPAEMSDGSGGASAGTTSPHSPIRVPPTGFAGTGNGCGAVAPGGTSSEVSTGGGGWFRCAQSSVTGVAMVSLGGTYGSPFGAAAAVPIRGVTRNVETRTATANVLVRALRPRLRDCRAAARPEVVVIIGADCICLRMSFR